MLFAACSLALVYHPFMCNSSPSGIPLSAPNGPCYFPVPAWQSYPWLRAAFTTRLGGHSSCYGAARELNLQFTQQDDPALVTANRQALAEALSGSPNTPLITLRQIHSDLIHRVRLEDAQRTEPLEGDGLVTDVPEILIGIMTADCIPVLISDTRRKAVGAFHAGWRGTVARIVESGVKRMQQEFGSCPADLTAAIGTGIGSCCYTVGEELRQQFAAQFPYASELFSTHRDPATQSTALHLDLAEANRRQLIAAGIPSSAIFLNGGCTHCRRDLFFSYRAEAGITGRLMSVIGIKSDR